MPNPTIVKTYTAITLILLLIWALLPPTSQTKTAPPEPTTIVNTPEPAPTTLPTRFSHLKFSWRDIRLLAQMEHAEARGESYEGRIAVVKVTLNRLLHKRWPKSIETIIYAPRQYTTAPYLENIEPDESDYIIVYDAIADKGPLIHPEVVYFSQKGENSKVAFTIGNHVFCYDYYYENT